MMMIDRKDFALQITGSRYCRYCTTPEGLLQTPEERKRRLTQFIMEDERFPKEKAEKKAIEMMRKMPAWKGKV